MIQNANTFLSRQAAHLLTVIDTDIAEAEELIHRLAAEDRQANPDFFAGLTPSVYFRMPYIPPCNSFHELRHLILRVRDHTGLRADFRGIVAIEATQWLGHEQEEYFTVLLKYLYDHRHSWRTAIILHDCKPAQLQRFTSACVRYMTPTTLSIRLFEDVQALCIRIRDAFEKNGSRISPAGASMLAAALARPELKEARSLALIHRAAAEVSAYSADPSQVSADTLRDYLLDQNTMLAALAGKILYDERSMDGEQEHLYL